MIFAYYIGIVLHGRDDASDLSCHHADDEDGRHSLRRVYHVTKLIGVAQLDDVTGGTKTFRSQRLE